MFNRISSLTLFAMLAVMPLRAQYDASFSHYWAMQPSFNPAAVGKDTKFNVVGAYSLDFAGYEHNPNTFYVGADIPLYSIKHYHGAGLSIQNDKLGLSTHQRISAQYAFRYNLFGGTISAGVQLGMLLENFDGTKLDLGDSGDRAFPTTNVNGNALDIGLGAYYSGREWYAGASVQHINVPTVELGEKNELEVKSTYYLTGGYNIKFNSPFVSIPTSILAKYDGNGYRTDLTFRVVYTNENRILYAGLGYSPTNSVTAYLGGRFHGINIGYSYEMYTRNVGIGNGSHGLLIIYQTDINLQKKGRNLHKSVRFL